MPVTYTIQIPTNPENTTYNTLKMTFAEIVRNKGDIFNIERKSFSKNVVPKCGSSMYFSNEPVKEGGTFYLLVYFTG